MNDYFDVDYSDGPEADFEKCHCCNEEYGFMPYVDKGICKSCHNDEKFICTPCLKKYEGMCEDCYKYEGYPFLKLVEQAVMFQIPYQEKEIANG